MFPLHQSCITIACRAIESHTADSAIEESDSSIIQLYNFLNRSLQANSASGATGVAAYDIFSLRNPSSNGPRSVLALDDLSWWSGAYEVCHIVFILLTITTEPRQKFFADPLEIPNLLPAILNSLQPLSSETDEVQSADLTNGSQYGLEALPIELLDQIESQLSARSILSLRQSSRTLASKIAFDERFWRRQLCNGSLLPHIWDLEEDQFRHLLQAASHAQAWDWGNLAERLRVNHVISSQYYPYTEVFPAGLWNRCRIWNIIGNACRSPCGHQVSEESDVQQSDIHRGNSYLKPLATFGLSTILILTSAWWDWTPLAG